MADLVVHNLEVVYNKKATAVRGLSLEASEGQIVALMGVNGSGKSTTLRAIAGLLPGDPAEIIGGSLTYKGSDLRRLPPHRVAQMGVVFVPERDKVFATLTVAENLSVPVAGTGGGQVSLDEVFRLFPVLRERRQQVAGYLSGGERQMLAIARALLCNPRLLLLDEMTLGLSPRVVQELLETLLKLRERLGVGVLLVEQNVRAALSVADYGHVIEQGQVVFHGEAGALRSSREIQESYLGVSAAGASSYRDVKQYRRTRRWWA